MANGKVNYPKNQRIEEISRVFTYGTAQKRYECGGVRVKWEYNRYFDLLIPLGSNFDAGIFIYNSWTDKWYATSLTEVSITPT